MTTRKPSAVAPLWAVVLVLALTLAAYVAGYFWLGQRMDYLRTSQSDDSDIEVIARIYRQPWLQTIYRPAGKVEELLRRVDVEVVVGPKYDSGRFFLWESLDYTRDSSNR